MNKEIKKAIPEYALPLFTMLQMDPDTSKDWEAQLLYRINQLIQSDFNLLVSVLYRIDVDEAKLKAALQASPQRDAALIIFELLIERQKRKFK